MNRRFNADGAVALLRRKEGVVVRDGGVGMAVWERRRGAGVGNGELEHGAWRGCGCGGG